MTLGISILACVVALFFPGSASPASSSASAPAVQFDLDATPAQAVATVTMDGEVLFRVHGVTAYPADRRAQNIVARIYAIAADPMIQPHAIHVEEAEDRSTIFAGDAFVMSVFDGDAKLEGVSRQILAESIRVRVAEAVVSYRHERSSRVLLIDTAYAAAATLALVLFVLLLQRGFRWADAAAERRFKSRIEGLETQSFQLLQAKRVRTLLHKMVNGVRIAALVVVGYAYLNLVLGLYPWTRPLALRLFAMLLDPLRTMGTALLDTLPNLIFLAILVTVFRYGLKAVRLFFTGIDHGTMTLTGFEREWAMPTYRIARMLIVAFGLVVAYPYIPGSQSEAFKGISIFLGVIVSLGSSSFISNMIAGYTMTYRRAYRLGDQIHVEDIMGEVMEMRLMVTHIRTPKNEEVVVPNSLILNSHVVNYSSLAKSRGLILHTVVGIGYDVPWRQVEAILLRAADRTPGLLKEPPPFVLQKSLDDFNVKYELNAYCDDPSTMHLVYTALHRNILDLCNEHGVQIMTPSYEGDPESPKVVPKDRWFAAPAKAPAQPASSEDTSRVSHPA
ncbi:MAG TPA: mechanosensitive ion channel family protein [Nitrospira sp.]|nr:mechanosensitive ion channel family protein [Nitrospira sp.]